MKSYALSTIFLLLAISVASGKILNGYENEIHTARSSLKHLTTLTPDRNVMSRIERIKEFILYYELTEKLLQQFQNISPGIYQQIDSVIDFTGRQVDVYVKFVPVSEMHPGAKAITNLNQMENDPHGYQSSYGPYTVSVKITITKHSLLILAHEFGHISYQVPNLATYVDFFSRQYTDHHMKADYLGHKPNDPSGQEALIFERIFRKANTEYSNGKSPANVLTIYDDIVKSKH
ncbi:MAG: hypothetical protein WD824_03995 [Cyclobacteriaceae bacterium]